MDEEKSVESRDSYFDMIIQQANLRRGEARKIALPDTDPYFKKQGHLYRMTGVVLEKKFLQLYDSVILNSKVYWNKVPYIKCTINYPPSGWKIQSCRFFPPNGVKKSDAKYDFYGLDAYVCSLKCFVNFLLDQPDECEQLRLYFFQLNQIFPLGLISYSIRHQKFISVFDMTVADMTAAEVFITPFISYQLLKVNLQTIYNSHNIRLELLAPYMFTPYEKKMLIQENYHQASIQKVQVGLYHKVFENADFQANYQIAQKHPDIDKSFSFRSTLVLKKNIHNDDDETHNVQFGSKKTAYFNGLVVHNDVTFQVRDLFLHLVEGKEYLNTLAEIQQYETNVNIYQKIYAQLFKSYKKHSSPRPNFPPHFWDECRAFVNYPSHVQESHKDFELNCLRMCCQTLQSEIDIRTKKTRNWFLRIFKEAIVNAYQQVRKLNKSSKTGHFSLHLHYKHLLDFTSDDTRTAEAKRNTLLKKLETKEKRLAELENFIYDADFLEMKRKSAYIEDLSDEEIIRSVDEQRQRLIRNLNTSIQALRISLQSQLKDDNNMDMDFNTDPNDFRVIVRGENTLEWTPEFLTTIKPVAGDGYEFSTCDQNFIDNFHIDEKISCYGDQPTFSGANASVYFKFLDFSAITFQFINPFKAGAGNGEYKSTKYSWGETKEWATKNKTGGCFIQTIFCALKQAYNADRSLPIPWFVAMYVPKMKYTTFWEAVDRLVGETTKSNCIGVDQTYIKKFGNKIGVRISVYNQLGKLIYSNSEPPKSAYNFRLLYIEPTNLSLGHFQQIINFRFKNLDNENIQEKISEELGTVALKNGDDGKKQLETKDVFVYYDLETVNHIFDIESFHNTIPFSIAWIFDDQPAECYLTPTPFTTVNGQLEVCNVMDQMFKALYDYIEDYRSKFHVKVHFVAFNGAKFDHHFFFQYLVGKNARFIRAPNKNKITTCEAWLCDNLSCCVWDPCLFLNDSLKNVAKSFQIQNQKLDLDHSFVQKMFERDGDLKAFFTAQRIEEMIVYNKRDVEVLKEICVNFREKVLKLGVDVYDSATIAGLAEKCFHVECMKDTEIIFQEIPQAPSKRYGLISNPTLGISANDYKKLNKETRKLYFDRSIEIYIPNTEENERNFRLYKQKFSTRKPTKNEVEDICDETEEWNLKESDIINCPLHAKILTTQAIFSDFIPHATRFRETDDLSRRAVVGGRTFCNEKYVAKAVGEKIEGVTGVGEEKLEKIVQQRNQLKKENFELREKQSESERFEKKPLRVWSDERSAFVIEKEKKGDEILSKSEALPYLQHSTDKKVFLDFVSLYPSVLETNFYPLGGYEYSLTTACSQIAEEHYKTGKSKLISPKYQKNYSIPSLGFWECVISCPCNRFGHSPIATKRDGVLQWDKEVKNECLVLPRNTIELVFQLGGSVKFTGIFIVWEYCSDIYANYIQKYKQIKENEDIKEKNGDVSYDPIMRNFGKLCLNAPTGKPLQRNFVEVNRLFPIDREDEARELIQRLGLRASCEPLSENYIYISYKKDKYEAYNSMKARPSHIGAMIYADSRRKVWDEVYSKVEVIYSDTDSALIQQNDLQYLANIYSSHSQWTSEFEKLQERKILTRTEKEFGMLDIEKSNIISFICVKPKTYILIQVDEKGKLSYKVRANGIRVSDELIINGRDYGLLDEKSCLSYFSKNVEIGDQVEISGEVFEIKNESDFEKIFEKCDEVDVNEKILHNGVEVNPFTCNAWNLCESAITDSDEVKMSSWQFRKDFRKANFRHASVLKEVGCTYMKELKKLKDTKIEDENTSFEDENNSFDDE